MPAKVFVSYARDDEELKDDLLEHLSVLQRQGIITLWHDRLLTAGSDFHDEIREQLDSAAIVLLLVSSDFLASDYCWTHEMTRALERNRVIPVILRPCAWRGAPFAHLTAAPRDGKPVTSWSDRDEALTDVVEHIRRAAAADAPAPVSANRINNLPPRNPNFTGRRDLLARLRSALTADRKAAVVQALAGLGGVGKTQLAVEYAHEHADRYSVVWWIRAEQITTLASDYAALAEPLGLEEHGAADQNLIVQAVKTHLEQSADWLLLFDNVTEPEDVQPFLPSRGQGHVIVTSRHAAWRGVAEPVAVDVMERADAIDLLRKRSGSKDTEAAGRLAEALGDLPLALEQAAAYAEKTEISLGDYLELFTTRRKELWKENASDETQTVAATWTLAIETIAASNPAAVDLLRLYAFLAPDDIPRALLQWVGADALPEALQSLADKLRMNAAVASLRQYSLVSAMPEAISVHRLVQFVVRDRLTREQEVEWARSAFGLLYAATPQLAQDARSWPTLAVLLPHVRRSVEIAAELGLDDAAVLEAGRKVANYLSWRADHRGALDLLRNVERLTTDESWLAYLRMVIAPLMHALGDHDAAIAMLRSVLATHRHEYGDVHPQIARDHNDIGSLLVQTGQHAEGLEELQEAERIFSQCDPTGFEPFHALLKSNLGTALSYAGQNEPARVALEEALAMQEQLYGADNAMLVATRRNLGLIFMELGETERAKAALERALKTAELTFGGEHPTTCRSRFALASYESAFGDVESAAAYVDQAVAAYVTASGPTNAEAAGHVDVFVAEAVKAGRQDIAEKYRKIADELRPGR